VAVPPQPRTTRRSLGAALLALGTRRTLLFLGTFLLVMSSLTLVVFSWASLPPLVQFAILAGTVAGLWGGGAWMQRKPDLAVAGQNLQLVAALLMPVVGFALGRPGLLDLPPRMAWQLASGLSLVAYLGAAWRSGRAFYSTGAALAAVSLLLALLGELAWAWQPPLLLLLLAAMLPLAGRLRAGNRPALAEGPRWVALVGTPLSLVLAALFYGAGGTGEAFASALLAGSLASGLAYRLERRVPWLWAAIALPPGAVPVILLAREATLPTHALALALSGLAYLGLSVLAEYTRRPVAVAPDADTPATPKPQPSAPGAGSAEYSGHPVAAAATADAAATSKAQPSAPAAAPFGVVAFILGLLALQLAVTGVTAARLALPLLVLFGLGLTVLVERRLLNWMGRWRVATATTGLGGAGVLLGAWLLAMLDGRTPNLASSALALAPLAGLYFAAAYWWPGRLRPGYDLTLQTLGAGAALFASLSLIREEPRLFGAALLALTLGGQATLRRSRPWAGLSLGMASVAAFTATRYLELMPEQLERAYSLVALGLAVVYSLGGAQLRRTRLAYWNWPGLGWATFWGLLATAAAAVQLNAAPGLASGIFLSLAGLLGLHTALWRRPELGYPVASLLVAATLTAGAQGFFVGWQPAPGDRGYLIVALALGLALLGQVLRRSGRAYGLPYELTAFGLLPVAPLAAGGDPAHLTLVWVGMALLYGVALWRYRQPWLLGLAFVSADLGLLHGANWLLPGGEPAGAGLLLSAAVVAQALLSAWARRGWRPPLRQAGNWGYLASLFAGLGALALAAGSAPYAAVVAGLLAVLLALLCWIEQHEALAWGSLAMLGLALSQIHRWLGLSLSGALLAGSLEALAIYALSWGVQALRMRWSQLAPWRRPLDWGLGTVVVILPLALAGQSIVADNQLLSTALLLLGLGSGLLGWRLRAPMLAGAALGAWALAVAVEGLAIWPPTAGAYGLLLLSWALGLSALAQRTLRALRTRTRLEGTTYLQLAVYSAGALSGGLAALLSLGASSSVPLALVLLGLAALTALVASLERHEGVAWASLVSGLTGAWLGLAAQGLDNAWIAAWLVLAMLGVCLAGWGVSRLGLVVWRRPSGWGALSAALLLTLQAGETVLYRGELLALTFALASLGLLLSTLAVRERNLGFAYAAGAAFVGAVLSQFADWGLGDAQWYVIPAGLYLLAVASGLRRFQGQRQLSQLIETVAVLMLLGVTFSQTVRGEGGMFSSLLLFGEALLVIAYGTLARLRMPFVGGVGFFVAGVLWMTVDTVRLTNQWVLLGVVGLLMVLAYVLLERYQERLSRAGRYWAEQLRTWG
jgi:hypothetical protein